MSATPTLPAIPDETALSREVAERPDWPALWEAVRGVDGKELAGMGDLGAAIMQELTDLDTQVKVYRPAFLAWYETTPYYAVEKAAEQFKQAIRLVETKRCDEFRAAVAQRASAYRLESARQIETARRALEAEQLRLAAAERQKELDALEAQRQAEPELAPEIEAQIEQVKAEPVVPVVVSKEQAAASLPSPAAKVSGRKVYVREIADWVKFLGWLVVHPGYIASLKLEVSFTSLKASNMEIPGVTLRERFEVSNRTR